MPIYLVKEKSLIGNRIYEAGEMAEYDGFPAENLEPTCPEGEGKRLEYVESNKARIALMLEQNPSGVGDPAAFLAAFVKAQADASASQAQQISDAVAKALSAVFPTGVPVKGPVKLPEVPAETLV